ncbi:GNAT family N-acetyltransferase [Pseudaestuariivita sp.]|uniref:GNAT family N-acetyltransferase n=1 Tax=Pseudaestuariivita sp. TaxID=2211669 RepID=UPI00405845E8
MVSLPDLYDAIDATWPALSKREEDGFFLRDGDGGGQRVSAATLAQAALPTLQGAPGLIMVRAGEDALDEALECEGYRVKDLTRLYTCRPELLTDVPIPRVTTFCIWEPLQIMRDIWAEGGIGPSRVRVMERAAGPKTGILGRIDDQPAAAAFVAMHEGIAMLHALEVRPAHRRKGLAQWMMRQAAIWAETQEAHTLAILVTEANGPANALYAGLGMRQIGTYHYRIKEG